MSNLEDTQGTSAKKAPTDEHVEFGLEFTKNLGNFENIKVRMGRSRPVKQGETPDEAIDELYNQLGKKFVEKVQESIKALGH